MTNEEKALKISGLKERPDDEERYYNPSGCRIYDSVLEMAKWKDKQYAKAFAPILIELDELKHQIKSLLP